MEVDSTTSETSATSAAESVPFIPTSFSAAIQPASSYSSSRALSRPGQQQHQHRGHALRLKAQQLEALEQQASRGARQQAEAALAAEVQAAVDQTVRRQIAEAGTRAPATIDSAAGPKKQRGKRTSVPGAIPISKKTKPVQ